MEDIKTYKLMCFNVLYNFMEAEAFYLN